MMGLSASKASAARAPGARITSPTRPSCRASPTHNNKYDFVTLDPSRIETDVLCRPAEAARRQFLGLAEERAVQDSDAHRLQWHSCRRSATSVLGGIFHAAVLFLVAAGLQLVFGVQKIVNLACGSFYALRRLLRHHVGQLRPQAPACRAWIAAADSDCRRTADGRSRPADRASAAHGLRSR